MRIFVPYHISGVWLPVHSSSPLDSGSLGIGIVLSSGVMLANDVHVHAEPLRLDPTTELVAREYGASDERLSSMRIIEPRPLGYGYGASAARALALAIALEIMYGRGSLCRAGEVAHVAEVVCGSGLGDVIAELEGVGLVLRKRHGPPCRGVVDSYVPPRRYAVVTLPLGRMTTREMHEIFGERIRSLAPRYIDSFLESPSIERFLEVSHGFSKEVGFLTRDLEQRVREILSSYIARGCVLGFFVKKRLLVVVAEPGSENDVAEALSGLSKGSNPAIDFLGTSRAVVSV